MTTSYVMEADAFEACDDILMWKLYCISFIVCRGPVVDDDHVCISSVICMRNCHKRAVDIAVNAATLLIFRG